LKLQQENIDRKNELVVSNLEEKVKELEKLLEENDYKIKTVKANLAEAHLRIENQATQISDQDKQLKRLNIEFENRNSNLKEARICYEHAIKELKDEVKAEAEKNSKLSEAIRLLRDTSSGFVTRCSLCLREIFNSVGAMSGEANYSADDITKVFEFVKKEVNEFDEVMVGHGDFVP
jgi:chromosome segregation ATPase